MPTAFCLLATLSLVRKNRHKSVDLIRIHRMWQRNNRLLIHITGQCLPHICHPHSFSHVSDQTLTICIFLPRIVSVDMSINGIPANTYQVLDLQECVEALPQLLIHVDGHTVTQSDEKVHEVPSHPASVGWLHGAHPDATHATPSPV